MSRKRRRELEPLDEIVAETVDGDGKANPLDLYYAITQLVTRRANIVKEQGFTQHELHGIRVTNSTSANPGKEIIQVIDLTK